MQTPSFARTQSPANEIQHVLIVVAVVVVVVVVYLPLDPPPHHGSVVGVGCPACWLAGWLAGWRERLLSSAGMEGNALTIGELLVGFEWGGGGVRQLRTQPNQVTD